MFRGLRVLGGIVLVASINVVVAQDGAKEAREEVLSKPTDDRRDLTLLRRLSDNTLVHDGSMLAYKKPTGWDEIRPQRLQRKIDVRSMTALGIERSDRDMVATIYWVQLNPTKKLYDFVRENSSEGEYGEEYETLRAVYGKDRVSLPTKVRVNDIDMYKMSISGGPDRGDKYDGCLYVFAKTEKEITWLVRVRVSFPKAAKGTNDQFAEEVIKGMMNAK